MLIVTSWHWVFKRTAEIYSLNLTSRVQSAHYHFIVLDKDCRIRILKVLLIQSAVLRLVCNDSNYWGPLYLIGKMNMLQTGAHKLRDQIGLLHSYMWLSKCTTSYFSNSGKLFHFSFRCLYWCRRRWNVLLSSDESTSRWPIDCIILSKLLEPSTFKLPRLSFWHFILPRTF